MKKLFFLCLAFVLIFTGCQVNNVTDDSLDIAISPSAAYIQLEDDTVSDFYYDLELKKDAAVQLKKIKIEYLEYRTNTLTAIPALETVQTDISTVSLTTKGDKQSIKGITYVPYNVRSYVKANGITALYAKVHFYFTVNGTKEVEKVPPLVEISKSAVVEEFKILTMDAYDSNNDGMFDEVDITLNKDVDEGTVDRTGKGFTIKDGKYAVTNVSPTGKKIIITLIKQTSGKETAETPSIQYSSVQGSIKDKNGNTLLSVTFDDMNIGDKAGPVLDEAKKTSSSSIILTFSERIADIKAEEISQSIIGLKDNDTKQYNITVQDTPVINGKTVILSNIKEDISTYSKIKIASNVYIKDINNNFIESSNSEIVLK